MHTCTSFQWLVVYILQLISTTGTANLPYTFFFFTVVFSTSKCIEACFFFHMAKHIQIYKSWYTGKFFYPRNCVMNSFYQNNVSIWGPICNAFIRFHCVIKVCLGRHCHKVQTYMDCMHTSLLLLKQNIS